MRKLYSKWKSKFSYHQITSSTVDLHILLVSSLFCKCLNCSNYLGILTSLLDVAIYFHACSRNFYVFNLFIYLFIFCFAWFGFGFGFLFVCFFLYHHFFYLIHAFHLDSSYVSPASSFLILFRPTCLENVISHRHANGWIFSKQHLKCRLLWILLGSCPTAEIFIYVYVSPKFVYPLNDLAHSDWAIIYKLSTLSCVLLFISASLFTTLKSTTHSQLPLLSRNNHILIRSLFKNMHVGDCVCVCGVYLFIGM